MTLSPFFTLHSELDREGPGEAADVRWAVDLAGAAGARRVADLACGPGADIAALLEAMPGAEVLGLDKQAHFVADVARRFAGETRVTARQGDMGEPGGPFDFIWCAGAIYFLGVEAALTAWKPSLAPGGAIGFTAPCLFEGAGAEAVEFWAGDEALDEAGIAAAVAAAGYDLLGTRPLSNAAWEAYWQPMEARSAQLRPGADAALTKVLDEFDADPVAWRRLKRQTGYLACVVRPR